MTARKRWILAQSIRPAASRAVRALSPGQWLAVAVLGLSGVAAFGLAPGTTLDTAPTREINRALPVPEVRSIDDRLAGYWREERIQRGDTVGSVLSRLGVNDPDAMAFMRTDPAARPLYQLRPGRPLTVETGDDGLLLRLRFVTGSGDLLSVVRDGQHFAAATTVAPAAVHWKMAAGEIRSSLFGAADAIGLPDAVTIQLADVFAGDIDFYKDIQRGDRFSVVYEMRYVEGEAVGAGRIVAAEFSNRGKEFRAYLWRDAGGAESYYAQDGSALRKAFLRSPMEFSRVTSGFSNSRFHPILRTWRAHKGIDYAAPVGTPVRATGNGKLLFAGVEGGYGKVIHLQNSGAYSTLYAHLSRFAPQLKPGARIAQGEVIGYVGQTGWATGPHLHYEFRVANEQRDPLTIALPGGEPLPAADRAAFMAGIAPATLQLALARTLPFPLAAASD
ncbi:MAG: peptidoglycan DD-metalloendopeptidase family protein [Aromatoleum sp.]|nr:peptidoglycan DD-metalloendopeptidase family protein [Aromatoleum sp.]